MNKLFRTEAVEARRKRLYGNIVVRTPARLAVAVWVLLAVALGGAAYAMSADYTRWEVVEGYVYPKEGVAKIFAPRVGTVSKIFVKEGDVVRAGAPLVEISIRDLASSDEPSRAALRELLLAQRDSAEDQSLLAGKQIANQAEQRRARLASALSQGAALEGQILLQREKLVALERSFEQLGETLAKGYISHREYDSRRAELLTAKQVLGELTGRREEARAAVAALQAETASSRIEQQMEHGVLRRDLLRYREQATSLGRDETYVVVASAAGVVTGLTAKVGAVADDRSTLGYIVPADATMEAVLLVPTRSAGFLRTGQDVRIEYDAFPYQQFGRYPAQVESISRTIAPAGEQSGPITTKEPAFRVSARLARQTVDAYGGQVAIGVGMLVKARVATRRQRMIEWLTEPLRAAAPTV